jgi:hypothetical protein
MKNKIIVTILFITLFPQIALADFSAVFETSPALFSEDGIMPGATFNKYFKIYNSDTFNREVYIRAENYENDLLGGQMTVVVKNHDTNDEFYNGVLDTFLSNDWMELPDLAPGDEARYDVLVDFPIESGNEYQAKSLSFDIVLKSESDQGGCICHNNCGHQWQWRHWHRWNNVVKSWFKRFSFKGWKFG